MIEVILQLASDYVLVRVDGHKVEFGNTSQGPQLGTIDGMKLDKQGVIREFPDLEGDVAWRTKAIARFKEKIEGMKNEEEICTYIIEDLRKYGYIPKFKQKRGFRREVIK